MDKSLLEYLKSNCDSSDLSNSVIKEEIKNAFKVFEDYNTVKHSTEILLNHSSLSDTSYEDDYFDDIDIILDDYDD